MKKSLFGWAILTTFIILLIAIIMIATTPAPEPPATHPTRTAEEIGESHGSTTRGYGRGFLKGFRERK